MYEVKYITARVGSYKKYLSIIFLAFITVIIKYFFGIPTYRPNLVIPILIYLSMILKPKEIVWLAFIGGIILDVFSDTYIGSYTIPLILISWIFSSIRDIIYRRVWYFYVIATAVTSIIVSVCNKIISSFFFQVKPVAAFAFQDILINILIDSIFMLMLLQVFKAFFKE